VKPQSKPWTCQQDGACCREPAVVVMTTAERDALIAACPPDVTLRFDDHAEIGFVELAARPCPLYEDRVGCRVYAMRPVNCRRYACGRDDVANEPFVDAPVPARFYSDRPFRRQMVHMQQDAMRQWGHAHGWSQ